MSTATNLPPARPDLDAAIERIRKLYGAGAIMRLDGSSIESVDAAISTGSLGLDRALGVGGLPRGRVVELFGPESSGKTTLALHAIASVQADGGTAAFVDAEHALDPSYARALGVRLEELLLSQPDSGEQALEIVDLLGRSGAVDLIVVDSVAALTPQAELEGAMDDLQVGLLARMMSKAMRKLTAALSRSRCTVLFINQLRQKIGVTFGSGEVTTGGNALKYYASVRLDIRRIGTLRRGEESVGARVRVRVVKNKVAPPFRQVEFDVRFGEGISRELELLDLGTEAGVLRRSGSWYHLDDRCLGNGREAVLEALKQDDQLLQQVERQVRGALGLPCLEQQAEA